MPRGPAPEPNKRRRNAPTIPTTELPAAGRKGRPPKVPGSYNLQKAGREWWKWAWSTPQAMAWDRGAHYVIARRASLEDDLKTLDNCDLGELLLSVEEDEIAERISEAVGVLQRLAGGRITVIKEMRELDKVLGLNPKSMVELRWKIVEEPGGTEAKPATAASKKSNKRRGRLELVEPAAASG